jgi:hypothetical protein
MHVRCSGLHQWCLSCQKMTQAVKPPATLMRTEGSLGGWTTRRCQRCAVHHEHLVAAVLQLELPHRAAVMHTSSGAAAGHLRRCLQHLCLRCRSGLPPGHGTRMRRMATRVAAVADAVQPAQHSPRWVWQAPLRRHQLPWWPLRQKRHSQNLYTTCRRGRTWQPSARVPATRPPQLLRLLLRRELHSVLGTLQLLLRWLQPQTL